jgi:hypothetical protein
MTRRRDVQVSMSLAALSVLALAGTPAAAGAQVCGPGPHWVDVCPTGVDAFASLGSMTVELFGVGTFTFTTIDRTVVWRGNPVDAYVHPFRGAIGDADAHLDVIPTELGLLQGASRELVGGAPVLFRAGDGIANGVADNAMFSPGAIDEYPATFGGCPAPLSGVGLNEQACSFFDVFFEIEHPLFGRLHNVDPASAVGEEPLCAIGQAPLACNPQGGAAGRGVRYRKLPGGGFILVDDGGTQRGMLLAFNHTPVPEPGTVALLAAGLAGVAGVALRRRSRAATTAVAGPAA